MYIGTRRRVCRPARFFADVFPHVFPVFMNGHDSNATNNNKTPDAGAGASAYGAAIDVGTSSIWSRLVRLADGSALGTRVLANPQQEYGADIASRVGLAAEQPAIRTRLHRQLIDAINDSLDQLSRAAGIDVADICNIAAVGNSAMFAFLLDLDPAPLCGSPYNLKGARDYFGPAGKLGIAAPKASLLVPRPIFGFVGSDALADILMVGMAHSDETELAVDVGTNCEIALGSRGKILVASTPAGPAYEDAHMSFGLSATAGAVCQARLDGEKFVYEVVGGGEAKGICGSGLIDIIAEMRRHGWVDNSGRLLKEGPVVIAGGEDPVTVGQRDIRSFQLVKASVHAAISVLQKKLGAKELGRMLITGTFGSYINLDNARLLKMFPDLPDDRIEVAADAACQGAVLMLTQKRRAGLDLEEVRAKIHHIPLPLNKVFQDEFIRLMEI